MRIGDSAWPPLRRLARRLRGDERGAASLWSLMSFLIITAICGLAVDATNAFRARTMLQATADAAALAAAIDLPDTAVAAGIARTYAARNMPPSTHGEVLRPEDVSFGAWDAAARVFTAGAPEPDAVLVVLRRAAANGNAWPTSLLRIVGRSNWDISAAAIAQRFIPQCLTDGLVARGMVDISSNNAFSGGMCVHGNAGVDMQNENRFASGVRVSVPDLPDDLYVPSGDIGKNPGLADALVEDILDPRMVDHIEEIIAGLLDRAPAVTPDYINPNEPVIVKDDKFDFSDLEPGRVYHIQCPENKIANIPGDAPLDRVVIVADCRLHVGEGAQLSDVVLASRAAPNGNDKVNLDFAADVTLGADDDCAAGGGVQLFSTSSVHVPSSTTHNGVQIVAADDIDLGARVHGIHGMNAQAGGDITMTSRDAIGACTGGAPALFTSWYYRLVF